MPSTAPAHHFLSLGFAQPKGRQVSKLNANALEHLFNVWLLEVPCSLTMNWALLWDKQVVFPQRPDVVVCRTTSKGTLALAC